MHNTVQTIQLHILPKHPHTCQNIPPPHTHTHITKQIKTTTVQDARQMKTRPGLLKPFWDATQIRSIARARDLRRNRNRSTITKNITDVAFESFTGIEINTCSFELCKSVPHHTIQINQPTRCNNFSSLLLEVYLQLNMFRASLRPSSGAQQLQQQPLSGFTFGACW
jgi:hypothetical protein